VSEWFHVPLETSINIIVSSDVEALFEPSIQAIIDAIDVQRRAAREEISVSQNYFTGIYLYMNPLASLSFLSVVLPQMIGYSLNFRHTFALTRYYSAAPIAIRT
jgi:hypothetical protein